MTHRGTEIITILELGTAKSLAGKCLSDSNFMLLNISLEHHEHQSCYTLHFV